MGAEGARLAAKLTLPEAVSNNCDGSTFRLAILLFEEESADGRTSAREREEARAHEHRLDLTSMLASAKVERLWAGGRGDNAEVRYVIAIIGIRGIRQTNRPEVVVTEAPYLTHLVQALRGHDVRQGTKQ